MPEESKFSKAQLVELNPDLSEKSDGKTVSVQFNPETLKVSFANQLVQPSNAGGATTGDQSNQAGRQFVGAGTTKLSFQLWFDVGAQSPTDTNSVIDVREMTKNVAFFITPIPDDSGEHYYPPGVSFRWGSFKFDGLMDSLEESLEFFSADGLPLRASMSVNMSQQRIQAFSGKAGSLAGQRPPGAAQPNGAAPGTAPLKQAPAGSSMQALISGAGKSANWQAIAEANGIENPRLLAAGTLINLNFKRK